MNLLNDTQQQLLSFSQFQSLQEFEESIQMWLQATQVDFTKGESICFQLLLQSSQQFPGVCYQKIHTLLNAIQENQEINLSRDTFKRMLRKAKARGLITVHTTVRENGSQNSNLYVYNQFTPTKHEEAQRL
ncbi:hypothetical protein [Niallia sp. Krafla_26]|uniref:hypothetical protein n=1 Tax=Niallia sp. Krafla_26 TaxID=3064703 RepID=UPI003D164924